MDYKNLLNELVENLVNQNGSDLHLGVGRRPHIRVDGQLVQLVNFNVSTGEEILGILLEMIGPDRYKKFQEKKDVDFSTNLNDGKFGFDSIFNKIIYCGI